jgi:hypothetical protein
MAVWALVLGIVPVFAGLLGIGLGIAALSRIKRSGRKGRGLAVAGIVLGALWLVALLGFTVRAALSDRVHRDASGAPTSSGPVSLGDIRVGDCTKTLPLGTHIVTLNVVPCAQPHLGEVFLTYDFPSGGYPGEVEVTRESRGRCQEALPAYVGASPGETGYNIVYVKPSASSWARGRRHVICELVSPTHAELTGSARGAGGLGG